MRRAQVVSIVLAATASVALADRVREMPAQHRGPRDPGLLAPSPPPPPLPLPRPPAPPPEIAKLGRELAGTMHCKGVWLHADGSSTPLVATIVTKLDLDNAWIQTTLVEDNKPGGLKFVDYRTYDAVAKQWTRIQLDNATAHVVESSVGAKNGVWTWSGTSSTTTGTFEARDFEQRDKGELKVWGEALLGGAWQKLYEATCKK
jgi:hypothetical protein